MAKRLINESSAGVIPLTEDGCAPTTAFKGPSRFISLQSPNSQPAEAHVCG